MELVSSLVSQFPAVYVLSQTENMKQKCMETEYCADNMRPQENGVDVGEEEVCVTAKGGTDVETSGSTQEEDFMIYYALYVLLLGF